MSQIRNWLTSKYNPFIITFVFLYLYIPPLFNINIMHILTIVSIVLICLVYKNTKDVFSTLKQSKLYYFNIISLASLFIVIVLSFFTKFSIKSIYTVALPFTEIFICGLFIIIYAIRHKYNLLEFIHVVFIVASIQTFIAVVSLLVPALRTFIINIYLLRGYPKSFLHMSWRLFGFSNSLTYSMAIVQAVLACIALYLCLNHCWKYIFFVPAFLFSSIINARTGIIIFAIGMVLIVIYSVSRGNKKKNRKILYFILGLLGISGLGLFIINLISPSTVKWILSFFTQIVEFVKGRNVQYFADTFGKGKLALPTGKAFFFGIGHNMMGARGANCDIGFINDIFMGGIFYAITVWGAFAFLFKLSFQKGKNLNGFLAMICIITFFVANFKGMLITQNEILSLIYLLTLYLALNKEDESRKKIEQDSKCNCTDL